MSPSPSKPPQIRPPTQTAWLEATLLVSLRKLDNPFMFVKTDERARARLEERRRALAAAGKKA